MISEVNHLRTPSEQIVELKIEFPVELFIASRCTRTGSIDIRRIPMIAMAAQFLRRKLSASRMIGAVMTDLSVTIEAEWNAVVIGIIAALG
jgi:hypothetical protein